MRIIAAAGEFDLPMDFETQITKYNAMLTDAGEQSNPITLRPSPVNMELVGWSNRLDAYYKPISDIDVLIADGLSVRPANLAIHTADEDDGISCTLYMGTGDFYSRVGNTRLKWLTWPTVKSPNYENESLEQRVDYLIGMLKEQFSNPHPGEQYKVAPVATTEEIEWFDEGISRKRPFILNCFEDFFWSLPAEGEVNIQTFQGEYVHSKLEGDDVITLGKGYGMTPFLKLGYVLGVVFSKFGYSFDSSEIEEMSANLLADTVVLNNVADAIYSGVLKYSQLLPDMLIKDFIKETERSLAGKFIVNEVTKVIRFRFYKTTLKRDVVVDLTPYLCSRVKLGTAEFKTIKISASEKLTETDETDEAVERFEFKLLEESEVEILFKDNFEEADGSVSVGMVNAEGIIYLNSTFVVNGETKESDDKAATTLQLFTVRDDWRDKTIFDTEGRELIVRFKGSSYFLDTEFTSPGLLAIDRIKWLYDEFIAFYKSSNIPATAKLMIPAAIIESIDQHLPVMLNGQKLLIEYMKKATANDNSDVVTEVRFRTLRSYEDR